MLRLLQIEMLKNLSYKPFRILTALYFIALGFVLFIGLVDFEIQDFFKLNLKEQGIYDFPQIWNFVTYIVSFFKIFLGMIIIFSVTQEFSNRMYKQNVIDGLSKKEFIVSKVLTIGVFTFISAVLVGVVAFILGLSYSQEKNSALIFKEIFFIGNYALEMLGFFSMLLFLSVLLRKSIFVLLTLFFYWLMEGILGLVEKFFFGVGMEKTVETPFLVTNLLPLNTFEQLIPSPITRLKMASILGEPQPIEYPYMAMILTIVWIVLFIMASYWILKKRDV